MSDNGQNNMVSHHRRPRISVTNSRKRVARPTTEQSLLSHDVTMVSSSVNAPISQVATPRLTVKNTNGVRASRTTRVSVRTQPQAEARTQMQAQAAPQTQATSKLSSQTRTTSRPSAKEMKEAAIAKAIATTNQKATKLKKRSGGQPTMHFGFKRVVLAVTCAAVAVFAIVYFVNINTPDISLKVAALQTGIEASYPAYIPRGFNLTDIVSENGKIIINFKNYDTGSGFKLSEEQSAWDSGALLTNYVKPTYGDNFSTVKEQGLTIYVCGNGAAWVNGGIVYKLESTGGMLTKKQIKAIATSL